MSNGLYRDWKKHENKSQAGRCINRQGTKQHHKENRLKAGTAWCREHPSETCCMECEQVAKGTAKIPTHWSLVTVKSNDLLLGTVQKTATHTMHKTEAVHKTKRIKKNTQAAANTSFSTHFCVHVRLPS